MRGSALRWQTASHGTGSLEKGAEVERLEEDRGSPCLRVENRALASLGLPGSVPSQVGQQRPGRGCEQGAGGQGSSWQDTAPSRQMHWWQGWSPDCGQSGDAAAVTARTSIRAQVAALPGALGERFLPGHCGQHSWGTRTGSEQASGGQRRARHCTVPLCRADRQ